MILPLFESAKKIYESALEAVRPEKLLGGKILRRGDRLIVGGEIVETGGPGSVDLLALGKASPGMAGVLTGILGNLMRGGLIVGLPGSDPGLENLEFQPGSHPLPDARSVTAGRAALDLAARTGSGRLLLAAISGGGSALACVPADGLGLGDKTAVTAALLTRGAAIGDMNAVRKHLSAFKGGQLARAAGPAAVLNILLSDVVGDDPGTIASGPGVPDATTFGEAAAVLTRFGIEKDGHPAVWARLAEGVAGRISETPKPGDSIFAGVRTFFAGRNADALEAARRSAAGLGFEIRLIGEAETGDARTTARTAAAAWADAAALRPAGAPPLCRISGGEHTVRVKGKGRGGRNQEFVLAALLELSSRLDAEGRLAGRDWLILSLGTDGIDGPTDAAGAWAGPVTRRRALSLGLDPRTYLENNDAYSFFDAVGGLIRTGPTGTNVMDMRLSFLE
jgi:glycerate 2-kinase